MIESAKKDPVIIISADYDGCFEAYAENPRWSSTITEKFTKNINLYIEKLRGEDDVSIELYVVSDRQSRQIDDANKASKNNGSAFETLKSLCIKKRWRFRPLLLVDIHKGLKPGTGMDGIHNEKNYQLNEISEEIPWESGLNLKCQLLQNQLKEVKNNHPDKEVTFVFFDDDNEETIFSYVKENLQIPSNITVKLVRACYYENSATLEEKECMQAR